MLRLHQIQQLSHGAVHVAPQNAGRHDVFRAGGILHAGNDILQLFHEYRLHDKTRLSLDLHIVVDEDVAQAADRVNGFPVAVKVLQPRQIVIGRVLVLQVIAGPDQAFKGLAEVQERFVVLVHGRS